MPRSDQDEKTIPTQPSTWNRMVQALLIPSIFIFIWRRIAEWYYSRQNDEKESPTSLFWKLLVNVPLSMCILVLIWQCITKWYWWPNLDYVTPFPSGIRDDVASSWFESYGFMLPFLAQVVFATIGFSMTIASNYKQRNLCPKCVLLSIMSIIGLIFAFDIGADLVAAYD